MNKHFMPQSKTTALLFSSAKYYYLVVLNITSKQDVIQIFTIFIAHILYYFLDFLDTFLQELISIWTL